MLLLRIKRNIMHKYWPNVYSTNVKQIWNINKYIYISVKKRVLKIENRIQFKIWINQRKQPKSSFLRIIWKIKRMVRGKQWPWLLLRYYPCVCVEDLRKPTKTLKHLQSKSEYWPSLTRNMRENPQTARSCLRVRYCSFN